MEKSILDGGNVEKKPLSLERKKTFLKRTKKGNKYVVHSVYITRGLIKIYYLIYFIDKMVNIVPIIEKT